MDIFTCDCGGMDHAWAILDGMNTHLMVFEDCHSSLQFCQHSIALKGLHTSKVIPHSSSPDNDACSHLHQIPFGSETTPVTLVKPMRGSHPLLSCNFSNEGPTVAHRILIQPDGRHYACCCCPTRQKYRCEHIQQLDSWLTLMGGSPFGELDEFEVRPTHWFSIDQPVNHLDYYHEQVDAGHQAVSYTPIGFATVNEAVCDRAKGVLLQLQPPIHLL
jgi:hypothetical protein